MDNCDFAGAGESCKFPRRFVDGKVVGDDDVVDALIDLCVVAIGTLNAFDVDSEKAWAAVYDANIIKNVGIKESRPNPLGLPDLIKPEGWKAPSHADNVGLLSHIFTD